MIQCADLEWLYNDADSAIGLKSGHEGFERRLSGIWSTGYSIEVSERKLEAARRAGEIIRRLNQLSAPHRRVLRAAYMPRPLDRAAAVRHGRPLASVLATLKAPEGRDKEGWALLLLTRAILAYERTHDEASKRTAR